MLKEVVDKERSRRRTRTPTRAPPSRAPPSPLSVPLVGEIPPWVLLERIVALMCDYMPIFMFVCGMQVFPTGVSNRGGSPFRETPRLWQHAAPSRKRRVLIGCHDSPGPQWVNPCWTSEHHGFKYQSYVLQMLQDLCVSLFCPRSVFRHYRVTQRDQGGYIIDVENPVSVLNTYTSNLKFLKIKLFCPNHVFIYLPYYSVFNVLLHFHCFFYVTSVQRLTYVMWITPWTHFCIITMWISYIMANTWPKSA